MELITMSSADGWWLVVRAEPDVGPWQRTPLVAWAMVDGGGAPFVVGLVVADGQAVEPAPDGGRYLHTSQLARCTCATPDVSPFDASFCRFCAGFARGTDR
jgi:hypothetical protein